MKFLIFSLFILSSAQAKECQLALKSSTLEWTAFKTPKKVGVTAKFDKYTINTKPARTVEEIIKQASFSVDTHSVNSGNPARDQKIVTYFFTPKGKKVELTGKVLTLDKEMANVEFIFNKVKKVVAMKVTKESNLVKLNGTIDVLDFNLSESLKGINEACKVLHEGKTWSDVNLQLTAEFSENC